MERAEILVARAEIQVQSPRRLPGVLEVQIEGVHPDKAFRIPHRYGRAALGLGRRADRYCATRNVPSQEVGQSCGGGIRGCGPACASTVRSSRAVEYELPRPTAVIKLIHARLAELTSESQLMSAGVVRNDVRQVARNVMAALRRRQPDLLKP